jgi:hypothetical protein
VLAVAGLRMVKLTKLGERGRFIFMRHFLFGYWTNFFYFNCTYSSLCALPSCDWFSVTWLALEPSHSVLKRISDNSKTRSSGKTYPSTFFRYGTGRIGI